MLIVTRRDLTFVWPRTMKRNRSWSVPSHSSSTRTIAITTASRRGITTGRSFSVLRRVPKWSQSKTGQHTSSSGPGQSLIVSTTSTLASTTQLETRPIQSNIPTEHPSTNQWIMLLMRAVLNLVPSPALSWRKVFGTTPGILSVKRWWSQFVVGRVRPKCIVIL